MIYFFTPYSVEKNIGAYYNQCMNLLPSGDDWACFTDGDAMFTVPDFGHQLNEIINIHSNCKLFTAVTNRVGRKEQCIPKMFNNMDIKEHLKKGLEQQKLYRTICVPLLKPMSGVLILINKKHWSDIGKFKEENILGIDNDIYQKSVQAGNTVLLMRGVYILHNYRILNNNTVHLTEKKQKNKYAIYTALIGNYDEFQEPLYVDENFDYHLFTDQNIESKIFTVHKVESPSNVRDCIKLARKIKILTDDFLPGYEYTVWIDANIVQKKSISELVLKEPSEFKTLKHPNRNCSYEEARVCIERKKDDKEIIEKQIQLYEKSGFPSMSGLIASGLLIRQNTSKVRRFCFLWWQHVSTYSIRDQISFSYIKWQDNFDLKTDLFDYNILNDFFIFKQHKNQTVNNNLKTINMVAKRPGNIKNLKTRTEIINAYISENNYKTYLEIGVNRGHNLREIKIENKTGVDSDPGTKKYVPECLIMPSDIFFKANTRKYDIIFIDGLHLADQVQRDIENALNVLNKNGTIICHDMLPPDEAHQSVPRRQAQWTGDCWKAWAAIRSKRNDLSMYVLDTDYGCGIINFGEQELISFDCLDWKTFREKKHYLMNIL